MAISALIASMSLLHLVEIWGASVSKSEFTRLNCVQQASIGTRVNLTEFARGRHC